MDEKNSPVPGNGNAGQNIERILDLQEKELAIKSDELIVRDNENQANLEYSNNTLGAQERDLKHQRETHERIQQRNTRAGLSVILAFFILVGFIIYHEQQDVLVEMLKLGAVFLGGYGWGRYKSK